MERNWLVCINTFLISRTWTACIRFVDWMNVWIFWIRIFRWQLISKLIFQLWKCCYKNVPFFITVNSPAGRLNKRPASVADKSAISSSSPVSPPKVCPYYLNIITIIEKIYPFSSSVFMPCFKCCYCNASLRKFYMFQFIIIYCDV